MYYTGHLVIEILSPPGFWNNEHSAHKKSFRLATQKKKEKKEKKASYLSEFLR
jgi:hypothetical protein